MQNVKKLLGRSWTIRGVVVDGERRGASIGYPTANVILKDYIHPMRGVYAVEIFFDGNFSVPSWAQGASLCKFS